MQNIEELIFLDKKVQNTIPEFKHLFEQWRLGQMSPALRSLSKRSLMDFMNALDDGHIKILEGYFGTRVTIDRFDYHIVKNYEFELSEIDLNIVDNYPNFSISRDDNRLYVCFWR